MPILISGSLAYDYIMDFPDSFKNHIIPDQIHILNVCFVVEQLQKNLGGVATNIAHTTKLLENEPVILSAVGKDGKDLIDFFKKNKIDIKNILKSKKYLTSSAHITTDKDDNQITAFYNGALNETTELKISKIKNKPDLAIISPNKKETMIGHAKECYDLKIPFCFDPGQQITALTDQELAATIGQAKFYIGNDYEIKLTEEKTGWDTHELLEHVEVIIITLGNKGSLVITKDESIEIEPCPAISVDDPTGAGDAYRGGFFSGYIRGYDLKTCGQIASVAAVYAVENYGTVNHTYTMKEFEKRYEETYHETISLKM